MTVKHILNLGAGVQSTTLYLMSCAPGLDGAIATVPAFDAAIFADTGDEPAAVYEHLKWLQSLDGPPIIVRSVGSSLGDDLRYGRRPAGAGQARFSAIPAFTIIHDSGQEREGRTKRQCTKEYKTEVIERAIRRDVLGLQPRQRVPKNVKIIQYFGISLDEVSRASRIYERFHISGESRYEPSFPLIDAQMTRANCLDWLAGRVPHEVPRSACVFCPFHSELEWHRLKAAGGPDWDRAVEVDHFLRTTGSIANRDMRQTMYVHRSCLPLDQVVFKPRDNSKEMQLGFGVECEGFCGV